MAEQVVRCRIDGHPYALVVDADSDTAARSQLAADWRDGGIVDYRTTDDGTVAIRWSKVATLEVDPAAPQ